tara:strand:+ start:443 stop:889 length:447 start_codon:yes stop_codon:yes gene_type:complete
MNKILYIATTLIIASSCTEVTLVEKPAGPPVIEYVDIQPREVKEFQDSILITFKYADPDGDLGYENPDIKPLSIHDLRLQTADYQHVGLLAPMDANVDISGELTVKLKNTFLLGSSDKEVTTYELIFTDRAGNASNPIQTDEISIVRR